MKRYVSKRKAREMNARFTQIARQQSAREMNCRPEDFDKEYGIITDALQSESARKYYTQPMPCNLVSYGNNVVASVQPTYRERVHSFLEKFEFYHCFEAPGIHHLDAMLRVYDLRSCFMAEYWLPDATKLRRLPCRYRTKILTKEDFAGLYLPEWSNALCKSRKELDILGIGAYDGQKLIALAACSADCDTMWQIGVDVLPAYRRQGIASALTSRLALEILRRGKLPFYCCAWSNIPSAKNALKSGFMPAWVELTVKPQSFVDKMNE